MGHAWQQDAVSPMDNDTEVVKAVNTVVRAFKTAADACQVVRERREKNPQKQERDVEEILEIKILLKSLLDGATTCRSYSEKKYKQFGAAYAQGDAIAIPALKDIIIALQIELVTTLLINQSTGDAILDFTELHEASITHRKDVTRTLDRLCQRIVASMRYGHDQGPQSVSGASVRSNSVRLPPSAFSDSQDLPSVPVPPSDASKDAMRRDSQPPLPPLPPHAERPPVDLMSNRSLMPAPLSPPPTWRERKTSASVSGSVNGARTGSAPPSSWGGSVAGEVGEAQRSPVIRDDHCELNSQPSMRDSGLGSEGEVKLGRSSSTQSTDSHYLWRQTIHETSVPSSPQPGQGVRPQITSQMPHTKPFDTVSVISEVTSADTRSHRGSFPDSALPPSEADAVSIISRRKEQQPWVDFQRNHPAYAQQSPVRSPYEGERASLSSRTTVGQRSAITRIETQRDLMRALDAPEVVSKDFGVMYCMRPAPADDNDKFAVLPGSADTASEKYLAQKTDSEYAEALFSLSPGMNDIWLPLPRPAMHNRYHGFCRGAWSMRRAVHEGLEVQLTPALKEPIVHWACKVCKFKTQAPKAEALPDQILFSQKYGVRYRWLFLAKSHCYTERSSDAAESYQYGCIFCASQGTPTTIHQKLDHLLLHIVSQHRTEFITPEIRKKTKCVIGGEAKEDDDWDISVPQTNKKGASVAADEFMVSASRLFQRRKTKR